jgi:hypothetical protein
MENVGAGKSKHDIAKALEDAIPTLVARRQIAETMWDTLNANTLSEPSLNDLKVCLWGTPEEYYRMEAYQRAERLKARSDQPSAAPQTGEQKEKGYWEKVSQAVLKGS